MTESRLLFAILWLFPDEIHKNRKKFNLQDQTSIGAKVQERKRNYDKDKKNAAINKAVWNVKRRKWVHHFTQRSYIQPTVREVSKDLTDEPSDSKDFKSVTKFVSHCLEKLEKGKIDLEENCCKNKYRVMGVGPKKSFWSTICSIWLFYWH